MAVCSAERTIKESINVYAALSVTPDISIQASEAIISESKYAKLAGEKAVTVALMLNDMPIEVGYSFDENKVSRSDVVVDSQSVNSATMPEELTGDPISAYEINDMSSTVIVPDVPLFKYQVSSSREEKHFELAGEVTVLAVLALGSKRAEVGCFFGEDGVQRRVVVVDGQMFNFDDTIKIGSFVNPRTDVLVKNGEDYGVAQWHATLSPVRGAGVCVKNGPGSFSGDKFFTIVYSNSSTEVMSYKNEKTTVSPSEQGSVNTEYIERELDMVAA